MNEEAREVLRHAALTGHRQARNIYHDAQTGADCALGVLHLTLHTSRAEAITCSYSTKWGANTDGCQLRDRYEISRSEAIEIANRNDVLHEDFLTIANKACLDGGSE